MASDINQSCWENGVKLFLKSTRDPDKHHLVRNLPACTPDGLVIEVQDLTARRAVGAWHARLRRFLTALAPYCVPIDALVQHEPHNTALVWGSIRAIIQILVAHQETSDEISKAFEFIGYQIDHYHKFLGLFPNELCEATTQIYALVFEFVLRVRIYLERPRAVRIVKAAFSPFRQKLADIRRSISEWEAILHQRFELAVATLMEETRKREHDITKIHRWLDIPPATTANNPEWHKGTCSWILQHETFQQWAQHPGEGCLWIHGKPGCGKSVMAKYLASTIKDPYVFTHFFRSHGDWRFGLASNFALSLISRALNISDIVQAPNAARVLANITPLMAMPSSECQLEQLLSILDQLLDLLPAATILVDALDECRDLEEAGGGALSDFLRRSGTRKDYKVLVLCSSHHYLLDNAFGNGRAITMDENAIAGDIRLFLNSEIDKAGLWDLQSLMLEKVTKESHGVFLWVNLMVQHVKAGSSLKARRRLIDEYPPELFHAYEKSLIQSAESFSQEDYALRYKVLLLLVGAQENLTAAEISTAMAFSPDTHELDGESELIDADKRIARVCRPLVEFTPDRRLQFSHGTVKQFLLPDHNRSCPLRFSLEYSHQSLARQTLQSLTQKLYQTWQHSAKLLQRHLLPGEDLRIAKTEPGMGKPNEFYEYSCRHWQDHLVQLAEPDAIILDLLRRFLGRNEFVAWSEAMIDLAKLSTPTAQVSVRATLQKWHSTTLKPGLRPEVPLEDYFLKAHQGLRAELSKQAQNPVLAFLPLVRLGEFYNVGGETVGEWELGYRFKQEVVEGYESLLGKRNRFTLNARTSLYQEYLWKMQMDEAREGLHEVAELQLECVGTELPDYYTTLFFLGAVQFHLTMFEDARQTLETSAEGLKRLLGDVNSKAIQAELFMGYALEAEGRLSSASALYGTIWTKWTSIAGESNGIALMIQTAQGSAERKQGHLDVARGLLARSWTERKHLFTVGNNVTVDSGIQLAIVWRDLGDNARASDILGEVVNSGIFPGDFERSCQVHHLRALIDFDRGRYKDGKHRLLRCLDNAGNGEQHNNNRELLWIRITLTDLMRRHGDGRDAVMLFADLVTPLSLPDELDDEPEPPWQLEIAEEALRYLKSYDQAAAAELLQRHGLRWKRSRDFWVLQGGPISDTARMAPPRDVPG